jgi:hypothetical protein
MDPETLAGAAVGLLVPYLERLGGKATDEVSDHLAEAALPTVRRLYLALKGRLSKGTYAGNQLVGLEERPERQGRQEALGSVLAETLEDDATFAAKVERLVNEANAVRGIDASIRKVEGPVAIGGDVHQEGIYVAGHDLHLGAK